MMQEWKDLAVLALVLIVAGVVVSLFNWATLSWVTAAEQEERMTAITALAEGAPVGEPFETESPTVLRLFPLGGEAQDRVVAEIVVRGQRDTVRFAVRLGPEGEIEKAQIVRESENPAYDRLFQDSALLTEALRGNDAVSNNSGASAAIGALREGIEQAREVVRTVAIPSGRGE